MFYDVVFAEYDHDYRIKLKFADGKSGIVDLQKYAQRGGIFKKFSDMNFFKKFFIHRELGVLSWPDGIDIAPERIYCEATDSPAPEWAEDEK